MKGEYIGDLKKGLWYIKHNMVVCFDYPHGVAIVLKRPARKYPYLDAYKTDGQIGGDYIEGYCGYTHRGGQIFRIGDRLFDENYIPKKKDYTKDQWEEWEEQRLESVKKQVEEGWYKTEEKALKDIKVTDFIPFKLRGTDIIHDWDEAKQAAINMSKYLG